MSDLSKSTSAQDSEISAGIGVSKHVYVALPLASYVAQMKTLQTMIGRYSVCFSFLGLFTVLILLLGFHGCTIVSGMFAFR